MKISQSAFDLIVAEEVSSKAYYIRHYQHPEWPGGASGVTIAIGYDLGYASKAKIINDWHSLVSAEMLNVMISCSGIRGDAARRMLSIVKSSILIPWDAALDVFANRDVPQWTASVMKAAPAADKAGPTCLGVIVGIAYNRGAGGFNMSGDRYREMRDIKDHMAALMFSSVPTDITSMKRLWPNVRGLRDRRDHEALLFRKGLALGKSDVEAPVIKTTPAVVDPDLLLNAGPARTKPPATTPAQHTTTGAIIVAGTTAATKASAAGYSTVNVVLIAVLAFTIAAAVWTLWYRNRNPK